MRNKKSFSFTSAPDIACANVSCEKRDEDVGAIILNILCLLIRLPNDQWWLSLLLCYR